MKRLLLGAAGVIALASTAAAADKILESLSASFARGEVPGAGMLRVEARLAAGWHVNGHEPSEDYLIPTEVRCDPAPGVRCGEPRYPAAVTRKFAFSEKPLAVYESRFAVEVPVAWSGALPEALSGTLDYQACNDRQCNPPATAAFRVALSPGAAAGPPLTGGAVRLSDAPPGGAAAAPGASEDFSKLLDERGLPFVLLFLLLGGLALNLTPCVYPVIPLTIGFFGGQAAGANRRVFRLAAVYVLGMATMYSALGVAAALSGRVFGAALQSPWVLAGIAAVLVLLSLSMFGLYDLQMPRFLLRRAGARTGSAGAYAMGLLVGIVAAPCVGPFVLGLLAFVAARQSAWLGFLFFFVLSLGLGLPYLFLGAFSGSLSKLPRAGEWMENVKKIFGWVLLAMAAYFLRTALPDPASRWILPAVLFAGAIFLLLRRGFRPALRAAAVVVFAAAGLGFLPRGRATAEQPPWRAYEEAAVQGAGRPAVLDFSAEWCIPCRELDERTFSDPRVRRELSRRALFKADMTKTGSPETRRLAERYRILGVPTIVFLDATGKEQESLRLVGFENAESFLQRLAKAP